MTPATLSQFRSPVDRSPLELTNAVVTGGEVVSGELVSRDGLRFPIVRGIPNLTFPVELAPIEAQTRAEYDRTARQMYDSAIDWQFAALHEDEDAVRERMVDALGLRPNHRVLEVGCGTGRDSFRLARRLDKQGSLFLQDLSPNMVDVCVERMAELKPSIKFNCPIEYFISNASYLPFPDDFFDVVFHFGGFNQFNDPKAAAAEFARVVRPGGAVHYGDEAVAPWLRDTEYGSIVCTNNPLFKHEVPLTTIPDCARDVAVRWIIGNCFYVISFAKGDGIPRLNLDLPHKGPRGGTMRTRHFGALEGVTVETKEMARKAAAKTGLSMHEWLDRLVRGQAKRDLAQDD